MILFWRISCFDPSNKTFRQRDFYLDTTTLGPSKRVAAELCYELNSTKSSREFLKYRQFFLEKDYSIEEVAAMAEDHGYGAVCLHDYCEDENGKELTHNQIAIDLSGDPTAISVPAGTSQYDIDYLMSDRKPIPIDKLSISEYDLKMLAYFVRDLREMEFAALMKDGPGRLHGLGGADPDFQTAVSDEEIRSFVTIFRRLYMTKEPHNFLKTVHTYAEVAGDYPVVKWVQGVAKEYESNLIAKPSFVPMLECKKWTFTRQRLIDIFLYTKYMHQPDAKRTRQFEACMAEVGNRNGLLTWLFITEIWQAAIQIRNAGRQIAKFFEKYCQFHNVTASILDSVSKENPGIGSLEKKEATRARIVRSKTDELAKVIWEQSGRPESGHVQFMDRHRKELESER